MKKISLFLTLFFLINSSYGVENFSQYKNNFKNYKNQQKKLFNKYLEDTWKEFSTFKAKTSSIKKPKPKKVPVYKKIKQDKKITTPKAINIKLPQKSIKKKSLNPHIILVNFFNHDLVFKKVNIKYLPLKKNFSGKDLANYWAFKKKPFISLAKNIKKYQQKFNLDDWSLYVLTWKLAKKIAPKKDTKQQLLIVWRLLNHLKYDVRVASKGNNLILLLPINVQVYGFSYIKISQKKFYMFDGLKAVKPKDKIFTYAQKIQHGKNFSKFNPGAIKWPPSQIKNRTLSFVYKKKSLSFTLPINLSAISLQKTYPQLAFSVYFQQDINKKLAKSLSKFFYPHIKNLSKQEAANFLLAAIQKSLAYKTDQEQFGFENYFFLEEVFAYPYADCEDRAFIYAWLVKKFLNINFVGLLYPNHLALAIDLKINKKIDRIRYKSINYAIADPTYIGAPVGKAQPGLSKNPKIIFASY